MCNGKVFVSKTVIAAGIVEEKVYLCLTHIAMTRCMVLLDNFK